MSASHQAFPKQFPCRTETTHERTSAVTKTRTQKAPPQCCLCSKEFSSAELVVRLELAYTGPYVFLYNSSKGRVQSVCLQKKPCQAR